MSAECCGAQTAMALSGEPDIGAFHTYLVPVGSRVTCSPPPTDTDRDFLVYVSADSAFEFSSHLVESGWNVGGSPVEDQVNSGPPECRFVSYVKGEDNLIVTISELFYRRFVAATSVAKRLNLLDKQDRIALFQAVLYGNEWASTDSELDYLFWGCEQ